MVYLIYQRKKGLDKVLELALEIFNERPLDKRRKYYLIVDTETATIPVNVSDKSKIALKYPLVYDIGWTITDINGNIYRTRNFLISEIFSNYQVFSTAYYAEKRSLYIDKLNRREIIKTDWNTCMKIFEKDLQTVDGIGAYNAFFDLKKSIPFTEKYIEKFYSFDWETWYNNKIAEIENSNGTSKSKASNSNYDGEIFDFRGMQYLIFDIWYLAVENLLNSDDYKKKAIENSWISHSGKFFSTNAENAYRFIRNDTDFIESHTALDDARIETEIFAKSVNHKVCNLTYGIKPFPYKILGTIEDFTKISGE